MSNVVNVEMFMEYVLEVIEKEQDVGNVLMSKRVLDEKHQLAMLLN